MVCGTAIDRPACCSTLTPERAWPCVHDACGPACSADARPRGALELHAMDMCVWGQDCDLPGHTVSVNRMSCPTEGVHTGCSDELLPLIAERVIVGLGCVAAHATIAVGDVAGPAAAAGRRGICTLGGKVLCDGGASPIRWGRV